MFADRSLARIGFVTGALVLGMHVSHHEIESTIDDGTVVPSLKSRPSLFVSGMETVSSYKCVEDKLSYLEGGH